MNVIITRHQGAIVWLQSHGIKGDIIIDDFTQFPWKELPQGEKVIESYDEWPEINVYGVLPINLWSELMQRGNQYRCIIHCYHIVFPNLPRELRGQELTSKMMEDYDAQLIYIRSLGIEYYNINQVLEDDDNEDDYCQDCNYPLDEDGNCSICDNEEEE